MNLSFSQSDGGSSFFDLVRQRERMLLPQFSMDGPEPRPAVPPVPYGTTVLALRYQGGVIIAGDRQATEGYQVASRRIEKVYAADDHSAIAIAGAAGPCLEMARLFQTELAHYEKLEGIGLSLEGKANKLAQMVRANLPLAMQGLIVVPIFVGYDLKRDEGRIYKYDLAGGRYEETEYYAIGSGGKDARATMKKLYRPAMSEDEAVHLGVEALYDAADEDTGTGGPDFVRRIFPSIKLVTQAGIQDIPEDRVASLCEAIANARRAA
ncbi:MAG TPA: proteasome subunit beta [Candidatus Acidoferrum sp.]|nr:proteasome subunit beta [Candidatus Acidoferrum sp.]